MKILICAAYFLPHRGGVENYVYQTARRLLKRGHKVWVATSRVNGMKKEEVIDGIHVLRVPAVDLLPDRFPVQLPLMSAVARQIGRIDVIVTNTRFNPISLGAGMYAHFRNIPWLHIEHGTSQPYKNAAVQLAARTVDAVAGRWIMRHAEVAGVSEASCRFAKKLGARKCLVLYNGVDTKFFDGRRKKHGEFTIAFVGRLTAEKGVHDLLNAVKGLKVRVVVVGKGPYEKELRKLGGVFVGEKDAKGVREVLAGADILVNPSYGEGLPTSVLEGGAMGLPVVATDVGGTCEVIDDKKNGFLVEAGDVKSLRECIIRLKDSKLREKFGRELQKKVRKTFDWDIIANKFERVLKSL
jgi:glycosyltransferase involved in cell wall biosynthesis